MVSSPIGSGSVSIPVWPTRTRPSGPASSHFRLDVQGLRGLAVLLVVLYHSGFPVTGGFVGVDVFFVISGFVITSTLNREWVETGTVRLRRFYQRRVKRLLPALSLMTVCTVVISTALNSLFISIPIISINPFCSDFDSCHQKCIRLPE